jgi:hypothetical protein
LSSNLDVAKENIEASLGQMPYKRKRSVKTEQTKKESAENEAISALAYLMVCKNPKKSRKVSSTESEKKIQEGNSQEKSEYNKTEDSNLSVVVDLPLSSCRSVMINSINQIVSGVFISQRTKNHVEIAWMTQKLRVSM